MSKGTGKAVGSQTGPVAGRMGAVDWQIDLENGPTPEQEAVYDAWGESLTADEALALAFYVGGGYRSTNKHLRGKNTKYEDEDYGSGHWLGGRPATGAAMAREVGGAMAKVPEHGRVTVYREFGSMSSQRFAAMKSFVDPGFCSCTLKATGGLGGGIGGGQRVRIVVKPGRRGVWLGDSSASYSAKSGAKNRIGMPGEAEFLLRAGTKFTWKTDKQGRYLEAS